MNINVEDHHFDTTEVIEAEPQVVLNTTCRIHLKNGRSTGNSAYAQKGTYFEGDSGQQRKR
jgi:hypothetical protein